MFKRTKITIAALATLFTLGFAPDTQAQGLQFSFGKHGRNKHFNLNIGFNGQRHRGHRHGGQRQGGQFFGGHIQQVHHHNNACRRWIPGRCEVIQDRVWRPGCSRRVWHPPVYETRYDSCGNPVQVLVRPGHYDTVQDPGRWELVQRTVQRPGQWQLVCGH